MDEGYPAAPVMTAIFPSRRPIVSDDKARDGGTVVIFELDIWLRLKYAIYQDLSNAPGWLNKSSSPISLHQHIPSLINCYRKTYKQQAIQIYVEANGTN